MAHTISVAWVGITLVILAWAIVASCLCVFIARLLHSTERKLKDVRGKRDSLARMLSVSEDTVQDLLGRLDQLDPMNDAFIQGVLDLASEPGVTAVTGNSEEPGATVHYDDGTTAKVLPFRQVGEPEL